ncbi:hypothetical protein Dimus_010307 [Dionaea muscipula]
MAEVTLISKRSVVSSTPVQLGKFYPLSVLDRVMEKHRVQMVYYYRSPTGTVKGDLSSKLRDSITETLLFFPIVTGRLIRDDGGKWVVKCNDAGMRIVEARAQGSVDTWLENADKEKELQLLYWEDMPHNPYFWPTFQVQMTEFEEGGLAVGLSCSHLLADPICASRFIKSWADVSLTGKMLDPPFFYPLPQRRQPRTTSLHNTHLLDTYRTIFHQLKPSSSLDQGQAEQLRTLTLTFTNQMVQASVDLASAGIRRPSPFQALAGLFWASISRIKGAGDRFVDMSICMDTRKILGLDQGFFGNCMVYNKVLGDGLDVNSISQATRGIGEAMKKVDYNGVMDLIEWLEHNDDQSPPSYMDSTSDDLICVSLEHIDPYSGVFGECMEPLRLSCYIEPVSHKGKVVVLPSPPSSEGPLSRVVMVTLPEDEVCRLCEDVLMTRFFPTGSQSDPLP